MRIQIELPPSDVNAIKTLMTEANIETYKDLFRNALLLLYWAVREVKNSRIIASVRSEEVDKSDISCKQIVMPILDRLAKAPATGESADIDKQVNIEALREVERQARREAAAGMGAIQSLKDDRQKI